MDYYGEDYDEAADHNDDYEEEDIANGHDLDEEDVEEIIKEKELYDSDEEKENFDEFEENDILGVEQEVENNVDEFPTSSKKAEKEKKEKSSKVVAPEKRITHPIMTKFEYARLISSRANMIATTSIYMNPNTKFKNAIDIAKEETEMGINPIIIVRVLPNGNIEEWKCSELALPKSYK